MSFFALSSAIAIGLLLGILGLGVFVSFRILRYPDLTAEGSFLLGACITVAAIRFGVQPIAATAAGVVTGAAAGYTTGILSTCLRIPPVVAGILVATGCYSVCLLTLHAPNVTVDGGATIFGAIERFRDGLSPGFVAQATYPVLFLVLLVLAKVGLDVFLRSERGMALRAAGSNPAMASAQGINPDAATRAGLMIANGIIALSGSLFAQSEHFADVNMGFGMLVVGLASVFIGEAIEGKVLRTTAIGAATTAVVLGSLVHRFAIAAAYEIGLPTDYFSLFTSLLVLFALLVPSIRQQLVIVMRRAF